MSKTLEQQRLKLAQQIMTRGRAWTYTSVEPDPRHPPPPERSTADMLYEMCQEHAGRTERVVDVAPLGSSVLQPLAATYSTTPRPTGRRSCDGCGAPVPGDPCDYCGRRTL